MVGGGGWRQWLEEAESGASHFLIFVPFRTHSVEEHCRGSGWLFHLSEPNLSSPSQAFPETCLLGESRPSSLMITTNHSRHQRDLT